MHIILSKFDYIFDQHIQKVIFDFETSLVCWFKLNNNILNNFN